MDSIQGRGNAGLGVLGFVLLLAFLVAEEVSAAEQHSVGGSAGWSLPSITNVNYTVWASTQTFMVGDTLYFNYSSAQHNVMEVMQADYESCGTSNPKETWTSGSDVIALNSSGTFYYICGIPGHCADGQRVAVAVTAAAAGTQHQVGGTPGWSLPSRSNVNYTVWASEQTFLVGDTLYFNYSSEYHNVMEVTEASYGACNASDPIRLWDDGKTIVALNATGTFYFICGVSDHCVQGQKFAAMVSEGNTSSPVPSGAVGASPPAGGPAGGGPSAPPPGSASAPPSRPISPLVLSALLLAAFLSPLRSSF